MKLYPRKALDKIRLFLDKKTIIVLHGSRQVGKTSIMQYLIKSYLPKNKKIKNSNIRLREGITHAAED